ncbi:DUF2690 domain-containing protein [Streptomyces sp. NPDC059071]|uniref:DUF2690 domain-containing protein n=1 Tax=unclassified Streptomyces TaxID=2593676 RepID=UPI003640CD4A
MLLVVVGAASLPLDAAAASPAGAPAASCVGAECTDKDPVAMGCDAGARTVASESLPGGGLIELRWSAACRANWARVSGVARGTWFGVENDLYQSIGDYAGTSRYSYTDMVNGTVSAHAGAEANGRVYWTRWV